MKEPYVDFGGKSQAPDILRKGFLLAVCIFASVPTLKVGAVEILELLFIAHFIVLLTKFIFVGFRFHLTPLWKSLGIPNAVFLLFVAILAAFSLRLQFFPVPSEPGLLKQPFFLSLSRLVEYFLASFYMIYVACGLRTNRALFAFTVRAYFLIGVCSALYGLLSFPLFLASGLELGAYDIYDPRVRGFFNEGGPFGLYLISVFLCGFLLVQIGSVQRRHFNVLCALVLLPALFFSGSKAAFSAILLVSGVFVMFQKSIRTKLLLGCLALGIVTVFVTNSRISTSFLGYFSEYSDGGEGQAADFGGRAAGLILIPRMISAHPLAGIGFGNFPIMRNDPGYLQGFPPADDWELPGIGLFGYTAEFGIPLFTCFLGIVLLPLRQTIKQRAPTVLKVLASYQFLSLLFGTQLNLFFPWLCSSFALSALVFRNAQATRTPLVLSQ